MIKDIRYQSSFSAKDEEGDTFNIDVFVEIIDAGTRGNPNAELEGLKQLKTDDGRFVNQLEKGKYQIVESGQILTSDDPKAL